jgi:hypothetical protein
MTQPLDFDSPEAAWSNIVKRAKLLEKRMPVAAGNLKAAQHRDTLRYQQLRSGAYLPRVQQYKAGDFAYLQRAKQGITLAIKARAEILKVKQVKGNGVLVVQGKCGKEDTVHCSQVAPCHLPEIDASLTGELPATAACSHADFSACNILDTLIYVSCLILPWPQLLQSRVLRGFNVNRLLHHRHTDTDAPQARCKPCTIHEHGGANPGRCRPGLLEDGTTYDHHMP